WRPTFCRAESDRRGSSCREPSRWRRPLCPHRPQPGRDRNHSRGVWVDRTLPIVRVDPQQDFSDKTRLILLLWRNLRIDESSRDALCTLSHTVREEKEGCLQKISRGRGRRLGQPCTLAATQCPPHWSRISFLRQKAQRVETHRRRF